ncbi:hypothetical protein SHINKOU_93 [Klebsiella phage vB_KaeM_Shinkou]|nr:hypothetical protein SHINKOU_93 [Klebsiella phage vB_KaeM_Shinkou]
MKTSVVRKNLWILTLTLVITITTTLMMAKNEKRFTYHLHCGTIPASDVYI